MSLEKSSRVSSRRLSLTICLAPAASVFFFIIYVFPARVNQPQGYSALTRRRAVPHHRRLNSWPPECCCLPDIDRHGRECAHGERRGCTPRSAISPPSYAKSPDQIRQTATSFPPVNRKAFSLHRRAARRPTKHLPPDAGRYKYKSISRSVPPYPVRKRTRPAPLNRVKPGQSICNSFSAFLRREKRETAAKYARQRSWPPRKGRSNSSTSRPIQPAL